MEEPSRRDWHQRRVEALPTVPMAMLKRRDRRRSPTVMLKCHDWHRSPTAMLKLRDRCQSPTATLKRHDQCGLESSASPLSLIGDGLSFIGDGWAQRRRWVGVVGDLEWVSLFLFFFLWSKWLLKCFVALGFFLVCWVLKLGL